MAALVLLPLLLSQTVKAFSLLGPYTDWMSETNDYQQPGDIGGPMDINEEYRWNVPTITYGFDKTFVDYFGSNGVAAVESAIQVLNDLPAASDIVLSNYPTDTRRENFVAAVAKVTDLKSTALALLVGQLGLGQPVRNILDIRTWSPALMQSTICGGDTCPNLVNFPGFVIQRNFDPDTLSPSFSVNGVDYACVFATNYTFAPLNYVYQFPLDPSSAPFSPVTEAFDPLNPGLQTGGFYVGLTRDDVGGLRYLLSATNVNWEGLPKNVLFTGSQRRANKRLGGAWRPGVEKLTFVRQPQNRRGKFTTTVFKYSASFVTNGIIVTQPVKRVVAQPDILFSVAETFQTDASAPMFLQTGTSNWINNAAENGSPTNAGPGVIVSPVKITFDTLGTHVLSGVNFTSPYIINEGWASFDQSTNLPILYPQNTNQNQLSVRLALFDASTNINNEITNSLFHVTVPYGGPATLQTSTNNTDWTSVATVTNSGSVVLWEYFGTKTPISFRILPGAM
jgi:hypothetical protein